MKLVLITWIDSCSGRGWTDIDAAKKNHGVVRCRSVGWILVEDEEAILLASSLGGSRIDGEPYCANGEMSIPKVAILGIQEIV